MNEKKLALWLKAIIIGLVVLAFVLDKLIFKPQPKNPAAQA